MLRFPSSSRSTTTRLLSALVALAAPALVPAQTVPEALALPDYTVTGVRIANEAPAASLEMPVSSLRYEPRVDVQARNLAEAQADVSVRGGVFENTGFRLGVLPLGDPQTGHYFAEIPVPPAMLLPPRVLTGLANAASGFNASVGTLGYDWRPIRAGGRATVSVGDHGYEGQALYAATTHDTGAGARIGLDLDLARSSGDGTVPRGDHDFSRAAVRLQRRAAQSQTDLFAGYQSKFFGWPNLYTPFGFDETENLQTVLLLAQHSWRDPAGHELTAAVFYRRNKDDYEFNRAVPGASNPFEHTTWLRGFSIEGRRHGENWALEGAAHLASDNLASTALTAGRYNRRSIAKVSLLPSWRRPDAEGGTIMLSAGLTGDWSDRDGSALSPLLRAEWSSRTGATRYLEYSEATQLPTYTALNSSATAGLFRGNPDLGRARSRNLEAGFRLDSGAWTIESALFHRWDDELVDWTFRRNVIARTANAVDISTTGFEIVAARRTPRWDLVLGYTWLHKDADYGDATIDASFYALNFARHRLTAALTWRVGHGIELRSDNELRVQEDNLLRVIGGDEALLSTLGVYYRPSRSPRWEFSFLADNLWNSNFQEVPAVPAARRQLVVRAGYGW